MTGPALAVNGTRGVQFQKAKDNRVQVALTRSRLLHRPSLISMPLTVFLIFWTNRLLIFRLCGRELSAKWRGTMLGMFWSLATPLLTFAVYSFAFGAVFRAHWSGDLAGVNYSLILFAGIMTFSIFSETVNRAPSLVLENVAYVKRVIFPLEILPIVALFVSIVNASFGFVILFVAEIIIQGSIPWTAVLVPIILLPYCLITLGLSWLLASLGVFVRDVRNLVAVLTSLLMFLTPVFYPVTNVPEQIRWLIADNPLSPTLNQMRDALFGHGFIDPVSYAISWALGLLFASFGCYWFMKTRKAFADVL
jgi:lipopolysaccharide transport system permease protein